VTLLQMVEQRRLAPVIDHVLPLAEAREGLRLLAAREVIGKVIVVP
jgi:NADPH:quinone reductase-like Zn-dependent oxidoreductase